MGSLQFTVHCAFSNALFPRAFFYFHSHLIEFAILKLGEEELTNDISNVGEEQPKTSLKMVSSGSVQNVEEGDILIGKSHLKEKRIQLRKKKLQGDFWR